MHQHSNTKKGKEYILSIPIPARLQNLEKDRRGYPIPFFIPVVNGKPEFKFMDNAKQVFCVLQRRCMICGEDLIPNEYWYLSGPKGLKIKTSSDPAMHEECARYSLAVCPYLHYKETDRTTDIETQTSAPDVIDLNKAATIFLVKATTYTFMINGAYMVSLYDNVVHQEKYQYVDSVLTLVTDE